MAKHAVNTTEAVPGFKAVESTRLDNDFEQMLRRYTPKNTEASTS